MEPLLSSDNQKLISQACTCVHVNVSLDISLFLPLACILNQGRTSVLIPTSKLEFLSESEHLQAIASDVDVATAPLWPVKFGQCWVFAGVLTGLTKSLGFPSRVVTNFKSADPDRVTHHVDLYYSYAQDANGNMTFKLDRSGGFAWNFHAWSEVWMGRSDTERPAVMGPHGYPIPNIGDGSTVVGWNAIDGTNSFGPAQVTTIHTYRYASSSHYYNVSVYFAQDDHTLPAPLGTPGWILWPSRTRMRTSTPPCSPTR